MCIPPYRSVGVKFQFQTINANTSMQFGDIIFANITSVGQNVDGFAKDFYNLKLIPTTISTTATPSYYNDTLVFDLGIVTNTRKYLFY